MNPKIDCQNAHYTQNMRIWCDVVKGMCGNQRYKPCKGWCVLTEGAYDCPLRENKEQEKK